AIPPARRGRSPARCRSGSWRHSPTAYGSCRIARDLDRTKADLGGEAPRLGQAMADAPHLEERVERFVGETAQADRIAQPHLRPAERERAAGERVPLDLPP